MPNDKRGSCQSLDICPIHKYTLTHSTHTLHAVGEEWSPHTLPHTHTQRSRPALTHVVTRTFTSRSLLFYHESPKNRFIVTEGWCFNVTPSYMEHMLKHRSILLLPTVVLFTLLGCFGESDNKTRWLSSYGAKHRFYTTQCCSYCYALQPSVGNVPADLWKQNSLSVCADCLAELFIHDFQTKNTGVLFSSCVFGPWSNTSSTILQRNQTYEQLICPKVSNTH